jgi:hypothetical protein
LARWGKWERARARLFVRLWRSSPRGLDDDQQALMMALVERTGDVLSPAEFVWQAEDGVVSINEVGRMRGTGVTIVWRGGHQKYVPQRFKVRSVARAYMEDIASVASKARGAPWPVPHARCRVRVRRQDVTISWTSRWSRKKLVQLRPVARGRLKI